MLNANKAFLAGIKLIKLSIGLLVFICYGFNTFLFLTLGFPIRPISFELGTYEYFEGTSQIIASSVVLTTLFGTLVTISFYIKHYFENARIYKLYGFFWGIASLAFGSLVPPFIGYIPQEGQYLGYPFFIVILAIYILIPTLIPAIYQHRKKKQLN